MNKIIPDKLVFITLPEYLHSCSHRNYFNRFYITEEINNGFYPLLLDNENKYELKEVYQYVQDFINNMKLRLNLNNVYYIIRFTNKDIYDQVDKYSFITNINFEYNDSTNKYNSIIQNRQFIELYYNKIICSDDSILNSELTSHITKENYKLVNSCNSESIYICFQIYQILALLEQQISSNSDSRIKGNSVNLKSLLKRKKLMKEKIVKCNNLLPKNYGQVELEYNTISDLYSKLKSEKNELINSTDLFANPDKQNKLAKISVELIKVKSEYKQINKLYIDLSEIYNRVIGLLNKYNNKLTEIKNQIEFIINN